MDEMTLEQKRSTLRTVVRKVVWDGQTAHVMLFGTEDTGHHIKTLPCEDSK